MGFTPVWRIYRQQCSESILILISWLVGLGSCFLWCCFCTVQNFGINVYPTGPLFPSPPKKKKKEKKEEKKKKRKKPILALSPPKRDHTFSMETFWFTLNDLCPGWLADIRLTSI